jgi:alkylation response protein AidB-like acyl-CoA dehydrogenase
VHLELTDDQHMLGSTVHGLLEKHYDPAARLHLLEDDELGWSREMWKHYAELGLLGLTFDEQYGGSGADAAALSVVMEAFGRALVLEPYIATVVLGAGLVASAGTPQQCRELLPGVAAGDTLLAFGASERGTRWSVDRINTTATKSGDGWALNGQKTTVLGGDVADLLIVSALTPNGKVGLFLVEACHVVRDRYRLQDGLGAADVLLKSVPAVMLGHPDYALRHVEWVRDLATLALCAEAVGAMEKMVWTTVSYLKMRVQFGQPIAAFQALQFRAADMYIAYEQAKSMALLARLALGTNDVVERRRALSAAKAQVDMSSRKVGHEAIQLHGGIGMTMEYPVGHYLKRTAVIARTFADLDTLLRIVGAGDGLIKSA